MASPDDVLDAARELLKGNKTEHYIPEMIPLRNQV
jgi:hypothetical protein